MDVREMKHGEKGIVIRIWLYAFSIKYGWQYM